MSTTRHLSAAPEAANGKQKPRITYLDTAKGLAIISVVILHLCSTETLLQVLAPWHIWQAVPIFMFVAGVTGNMAWKKCQGNLKAYYRVFPGKAYQLYRPYAAIIIYYYLTSPAKLDLSLFLSTLGMGYLGPGGYFVPLIVQHLLFFPFFLVLRNRLGDDIRFLQVTLACSILFELLFAFSGPETGKYLYRIYYFRYLFVCCLGAVMAERNPFKATTWRTLVGLSLAYMFTVCYLGWSYGIIRNDWLFQHYPAFFYTAFLVLAIRKYEQRLPGLPLLVEIGKNSYSIFMTQLLFFITIGHYFRSNFFLQVIALFLCIATGVAIPRLGKLWKQTQQSKT